MGLDHDETTDASETTAPSISAGRRRVYVVLGVLGAVFGALYSFVGWVGAAWAGSQGGAIGSAVMMFLSLVLTSYACVLAAAGLRRQTFEQVRMRRRRLLRVLVIVSMVLSLSWLAFVLAVADYDAGYFPVG